MSLCFCVPTESTIIHIQPLSFSISLRLFLSIKLWKWGSEAQKDTVFSSFQTGIISRCNFRKLLVLFQLLIWISSWLLYIYITIYTHDAHQQGSHIRFSVEIPHLQVYVSMINSFYQRKSPITGERVVCIWLDDLSMSASMMKPNGSFYH